MNDTLTLFICTNQSSVFFTFIFNILTLAKEPIVFVFFYYIKIYTQYFDKWVCLFKYVWEFGTYLFGASWLWATAFTGEF